MSKLVLRFNIVGEKDGREVVEIKRLDHEQAEQIVDRLFELEIVDTAGKYDERGFKVREYWSETKGEQA